MGEMVARLTDFGAVYAHAHANAHAHTPKRPRHEK